MKTPRLAKIPQDFRTPYKHGKVAKFINFDEELFNMATSIETIHEELVGIRKDLDYIKGILGEDFDISDYAKKALNEARNTPETEYIDL